jgi:hypothetical protein
MKDKLIIAYLRLFEIVVFFSSAIFMYQLLDKIPLPEGIIYAVVHYGYLLIHLGSFLAMLYHGRKL